MNGKQTLPQPTSERATYSTPKLVRYGKLSSLVQGGTLIGIEDSIFFQISSVP